MEWRTIPSASDYEMSEGGDIRRKKDQRQVEVGLLALVWRRGRQEWMDVKKMYAMTFGCEIPRQHADIDALLAKNRRLEKENADMQAMINAAGIV